VLTAEQRVRDLCSQLLSAHNDSEIQALVIELKAAIHQHCEDLKALAAVSYPKAAGAALRKTQSAKGGARGEQKVVPDQSQKNL